MDGDAFGVACAPPEQEGGCSARGCAASGGGNGGALTQEVASARVTRLAAGGALGATSAKERRKRLYRCVRLITAGLPLPALGGSRDTSHVIRRMGRPTVAAKRPIEPWAAADTFAA